MKVKLFTHTDLDGISCGILGILAFGKDNIDITYCNYDNVNDKVREFIDNKEYNNFDHVYITDISINEELAKYITNYHPDNFKSGFNLAESFTLIDHHPTALGLNKYWWCNIVIKDDIEKVSGTSLFYKELIEQGHFIKAYSSDENFKNVNYFVEKVKRYDTWLWNDKYNDIVAKQLNDLLYIYGRDRFIDKMMNTLGKFDDMDKLLLELEQNKVNIYIENKSKELIRNVLVLDKDYNVGIIFAEQYISQLGNELAKMNEDLDFIIIISNCNTISYRGIKNDIDLGKLAREYYSGGGHPQSAGSQIDNKIKDKILDLILNIKRD